jgi:hypothetical protein
MYDPSSLMRSTQAGRAGGFHVFLRISETSDATAIGSSKVRNFLLKSVSRIAGSGNNFYFDRLALIVPPEPRG